MSDPTALPNFPPPAEEHLLRGRVLDALQEDGFRPEVDPDGDVAFKVQGQQLFVHCVEGDVPLMRVFGQWQIDEELPTDELTRLRACNALTLRLNAVKVGLNGDTLYVTMEQICPAGADARMYTSIASQMILQAVQLWHELMLGRNVFDEGNA